MITAIANTGISYVLIVVLCLAAAIIAISIGNHRRMP